MRRKLALLLCVLYLANLFPSLYNVQAEATAGEVAWMSMGEPGTIGHGELISPVLNYRNDDTAVEILVTIESVYSSGLEPVPSNFTGPRTVFVEQGVSIGIQLYNLRVNKDLSQDEVTVTMKVVVQPVNGFSYFLTRSASFVVRHDYQYNPNPDGNTHVSTCSCGRTKASEPHRYRYIISDIPLDDGRYSHENFCDDCLLRVMVPCVFDEGVIKPPTCIKDGCIWRTCLLCTRGEAFDPTPATNQHTPGVWIMDWKNEGSRASHESACIHCKIPMTEPCNFEAGAIHPPSCMEYGYTNYTCTNCGYSYQDDFMPTIPHQYTNWTFAQGNSPGDYRHTGHCRFCEEPFEEACVFDQGRTTAPTCEQEGRITYTCVRCLHSYDVVAGEKLEHDWNDWTPSDGNPGNHRKACNTCGAVQEDSCVYGVGIEAPATCTSEGFITYTCEFCGYSYDETAGEKLEHDWSKCTPSDGQPGNHRKTCNTCGTTQEDPCVYGVGVETPATCTSEGLITYTCGSCGYSYDETAGEKIEHDWSNWTPSEKKPGLHSKNCNTCGITREDPCTYGTGVKTPATCTSEGFITYNCNQCKYSHDETDGEKLEHDWSDFTPSDNKPGNHRKTCNTCGTTQEDLCTFGTGIETPATCTSEGFITYTCESCGYSFDETTSEKLEHDWSNWTPSDNKPGLHRKICNICGTTQEDPCAYGAGVKTPATCTSEGFITYTCNLCGYSYDDNIEEKLEHAWGACHPSKERPGTHTQACTACGTSLESFCEYAVGATTPVTCSSAGFTTYVCECCGHSYNETDAETVEHIWDAFTPSEDSPGHHIKSCQACGITQEESCVHDAAVLMPPTCTNPGYTIFACQVCGYSHQGQPTPPTGIHSIPAWLDQGNGQHMGVCKDCNETFTADHDLNWTQYPSGAHTGRCSICEFSFAAQELACAVRMPGQSVALGEAVTMHWTLSGGLPPYEILDCYVETQQKGVLTHLDVQLQDDSAVFTLQKGTGKEADFVLRFRDSLGAVLEQRNYFLVTSGEAFDVHLEMPDAVVSGRIITASWSLAQAVAPVQVAGTWSIFDGDKLLGIFPCTPADNTCAFTTAGGSRGVLSLQFTDAAGRTREVIREFSITPEPVTPTPVLVEGIYLMNHLQLTAGSSHQLLAWVTPDQADIKTLHWTTSDSSIAVVNQEGLVSALVPGSSIITARATDGSGITANCVVTVRMPILPADMDSNKQVDLRDLMRLVDFLMLGTPLQSLVSADLAADGETIEINLKGILKLINVLVDIAKLIDILVGG